MVYRGHVQNSVAVLEPVASLREGTDVQVEPIAKARGEAQAHANLRRLRVGLLGFAGIAKGGPADLARNHDHYLHGAPRK